MSRWNARTLAGFAYLVPVANIGAIGYMLLFVVKPPGLTAAQMAHRLLFEDPQRAIFWWLGILAIACLGLALGYLSRADRARWLRGAMLATGAGLALAAYATLDASIAAVVALPLCFSGADAMWGLVRRYRRPAPARASTPMPPR